MTKNSSLILWGSIFFLLGKKKKGTMSTANMKKTAPVSAAWKNIETFTDYLVNKM